MADLKVGQYIRNMRRLKLVMIVGNRGEMLLKNRVALITGSGRGIGRAMALLFAREGATVFLTARTSSQLAAVAKEISAHGGKAEYAAADLSREGDCTRVFTEAEEHFGRVDILVNNAGHYGPVVPVEEYPMEEFDKVMAVHLRAAFLLSKLALPGMYARKSGRDSEYFELIGEGGVFVGLGVCGGEGGIAGADAIHGGGGGAEWRARECDLPRAGDGNGNEQGAWQHACEKTKRQPGGSAERLPGFDPARPRADGDGDCAGGAIFVLGSLERDGWPID